MLAQAALLVAGGSVIGLPGMPGLNPDVDLDGDGLERLLVDDSGYLVSCIDGDLTVIEGRDCWQDEGMADGFSFVMGAVAVPAHLIGLEPGWERLVEGTCDDPPDESLWGEL